MEQPTAFRPTRTRSSRQPVSTSEIRDRHALPSRTAPRRRRAARLRQIGGGQPSRRPIAGGPQSSGASLDRSGSARHARQTAGTSRQSHATLHRDLRPAKLPWAFDHRALRASWRSTIRPSRPKRLQSGSRVRRSPLCGGPVRSDSAATKSRNQATGRVSLADGQTGKDAPSTIGVSKGQERCLRSPSPRYPRAALKNRGCQRRPRNMAQPGDLPKIAAQRLYQNSALRRLGVKRSRVQIPAARLNSAGQRPCLSASWRRCLAIPAKSSAPQSSEPAHSVFLRRPVAAHRRLRTGRRPRHRQRQRGHPGTDGRRSAGRWPDRCRGRRLSNGAEACVT